VTDAPPPWPLDDLDRWVADAHVDEAVAQRRRTAWLRRQADEDATLGGVLRELGERGRPVVVHAITGRRHRGLLTTVGDDLIVLRTVRGVRVIVMLGAVISVRAHAEGTPVTDERTEVAGDVTGGATLTSTLVGLAGERTSVVVTAVNGDTTSGEVIAVGRDMLTLQLEGAGLAYVAFASVAEVVAAPESG
jgi:hypothetical protein